MTWQGLIEGAYRLRIQAVGYQSTNVLTYLIQGGERTLHVDLQPALVKLKLNTEPSSGTFRLQDHQGRWHTGSLPAEVELPLGDYLVHFPWMGRLAVRGFAWISMRSVGIATFVCLPPVSCNC